MRTFHHTRRHTHARTDTDTDTDTSTDTGTVTDTDTDTDTLTQTQTHRHTHTDTDTDTHTYIHTVGSEELSTGVLPITLSDLSTKSLKEFVFFWKVTIEKTLYST